MKKKKYTEKNLSFKIYKFKDKKALSYYHLPPIEPKWLAIILAQKTNSIEGNTTNLIDAFNILNKIETKGQYKLSEKFEIKNLHRLYAKILKQDAKIFRDKYLHYTMYEQIIDITFYRGKYKDFNNFTNSTLNEETVELHYINAILIWLFMYF